MQWYFLSRDEGVSNITGTTWTEDEGIHMCYKCVCMWGEGTVPYMCNCALNYSVSYLNTCVCVLFQYSN